MTATARYRPAAVVRPTARRARFWLVVAVLILLGALLASALAVSPGSPLDPSSPSKAGSKALATLLADYGAPVSRTTSLASAQRAGPAVSLVVANPDDFSAMQLQALARRDGRVVFAAPGSTALAALTGAVELGNPISGTIAPGCAEPGAQAAGSVDLRAPAATYRAPAGAISCYRGALVITGQTVLLGSSALLRNDTVADRGVAALDVNAITANRTLHRVLWLMAGAEASGPGPASLWQLFPSAAHRVFGYLLALGLLLVLWRVRRLGPVVSEPLPVIVRAAEVVEGHGRLYRRAGARDRAATALRAGTAARLAAHLGLGRQATMRQIVGATAAASGRPAGEIDAVLNGRVPGDDAALIRLAGELDDLEVAAGAPPWRGHDR